MFSKEAHILVVDDSANIRKLICDSLQRMGFHSVVQASDSNEGFGKLLFFQDTKPFDLILSDLNMPGPNGLEFLKKVRAHDKFKNLPFVLVTTEAEKSAVIEAATRGVSSYVVKPFTVEILAKRIQEAWKKHNP